MTDADTHAPSREEAEYLRQEYAAIHLESAPLQAFLDELFALLRAHTDIGPEDGLLDVGCGRGYFLEYLRRKGFTALRGIDPCRALIEDPVFRGIEEGSFEQHGLPARSFDVVLTCHTLHHLRDPRPVHAVEEMAKLSRRYVVIVEVNNTNLPMAAVSLMNRRVEANAARYNLRHVSRLVAAAGLKTLYAGTLRCGYISGDSWLHRLAARLGQRPYNVVIAEISDAPPA